MNYSIRKARFVAIMLLTILFVNCSNEKDYEVLETSTAKYELVSAESMNRRSYEEALNIAKNSISMIESKNTITRGVGNRRVVDEKNGVFTINSLPVVTRSGEAIEDTLIYVFNFSDNQGFAVVSANRSTEGLLAITESGSYSPNSESENIGFNDFMEKAKIYVQNAKTTTPVTRGETPTYWSSTLDTLEYYRIEPKISIAWGKDETSGRYCSNQNAGCGPIAMAHIMSYYQHPTSFTYTFGNRDVNNESVNWSKINLHTNSKEHSTPLCYRQPFIDKTIGRICRELGCKSGSSYNSDGTTFTSPGAIYNVLTYYGYTMSGFHSLPSDANAFLNYLQDDKIVIVIGNTIDNISHVWLVDGGYHIKTHYVSNVSHDGINWEVLSDWMTELTYSHINWGWNGVFNGFFLYNVFNAENSSEYDNVDIYNGVDIYNTTDQDVYFCKNLKYSTVYY